MPESQVEGGIKSIDSVNRPPASTGHCAETGWGCEADVQTDTDRARRVREHLLNSDSDVSSVTQQGKQSDRRQTRQVQTSLHHQVIFSDMVKPVTLFTLSLEIKPILIVTAAWLWRQISDLYSAE